MNTLKTDNRLVALLRIFVLGAFLFSILGTGAELLLLEHTEDPWMWTPLVLIGTSLLIMLTYGFVRQAWTIKLFQGLMLLFMVSGVLGIWFHLKGNIEFELEMYPSMQGAELLWEALQGASPALAPGTMTQLGLLGLIYTFKHPVLTNKLILDR